MKRLTLLLLVAALIACGKKATTNNTSGPHEIDFFSVWSAPGEVDALNAIVQLFEGTHANYTLDNFSSHTNIPTNYTQLLLAGTGSNPVDLIQEDSFSVLNDLPNRDPSAVYGLSDFLKQNNLTPEQFVPDAINSATLNNELLCLPVDAHREGILIYNKALFAKYGLSVPTSWDEFVNVADTLKANGVTPVTTSTDYNGTDATTPGAGQGSFVTDMLFLTIAPMTMGAQGFADYVSGKGDRNDPLFKQSLDNLATVLDNYINVDANTPGLTWNGAADKMFDAAQPAGMFLHADWAKGYYQARGKQAGVDFDITGAPGATDVFILDADCFFVPKAAPHLQDGLSLLQTWVSAQGQTTFNALKGSSPVRIDIDPSTLDSVAQRTYHDLLTSPYRMNEPALTVNSAAELGQFAAGLVTEDALYASMLQVYDTLYPAR